MASVIWSELNCQKINIYGGHCCQLRLGLKEQQDIQIILVTTWEHYQYTIESTSGGVFVLGSLPGDSST